MPSINDVSQRTIDLINRINSYECQNPNLDIHSLRLRAYHYNLRLQRINNLNDQELTALNNDVIGTNHEIDDAQPTIYVGAVPVLTVPTFDVLAVNETTNVCATICAFIINSLSNIAHGLHSLFHHTVYPIVAVPVNEQIHPMTEVINIGEIVPPVGDHFPYLGESGFGGIL